MFERAQVDEGSSRSHAIAIVYVEQRCEEGAPSTGVGFLTQVRYPPSSAAPGNRDTREPVNTVHQRLKNVYLALFYASTLQLSLIFFTKLKSCVPPPLFDLQSCFMLADLAASESSKRTDARFQRLEECKFINLSMSALGNCVAALAKVCLLERSG